MLQLRRCLGHGASVTTSVSLSQYSSRLPLSAAAGAQHAAAAAVGRAVQQRFSLRCVASLATADVGPGASSSTSLDGPPPVADTPAAAAPEQQQQQQQAFPELQLQLPPPSNALVQRAEFVKSSVDIAGCPPPRHPEFAVIGRSNVGKSSLINMLTNRKSLAMVSKQPGKTRCINHFIINDSWYLVDLPGYGYARTGKQDRRDFDAFTRAYLQQRDTLVMVLLLVDCSIPPQEMDLEYAGWLGGAGLPFSIVFTKADKRKKGQPRHVANVNAFKRALLADYGFSLLPPSLVTSAATGGGKQPLLNFIASLRVMWGQSKGAGSGSKQGAKQQQQQQQPGSG